MLLRLKLGYQRSLQELISHPLHALLNAKSFGGMAENSSFFVFFVLAWQNTDHLFP